MREHHLDANSGPGVDEEVCRRFRVGVRRRSEDSDELTEAAIIDFARAWDPQPFHLSPAAPEGTVVSGLIASGWQTAAITAQLLAGMGFLGSVGLGVNIAWPSPTRPADVLHLELTVAKARPSASKPGFFVLVVDYDTVNQFGQVRQRSQATLLSQGLVSDP